MKPLFIGLVAAVATPWLTSAATAESTRLLRDPDVSADHLVFAYASDLWICGRDGEHPRRLTAFPGVESNPHFSPDGQHIAFTASYDGNPDVYVISVDGGEPKRVTYRAGMDDVRGWTPDGEQILFASGRETGPTQLVKFWSVDPDGGWPEALPVYRAYNGSLSDDGRFFAVEPIQRWDVEWRNYRGGQVRPIWVVDLEDLEHRELPWTDSNDTDPMWIGDTVYFLSDRDSAVNVYGYTPETETLEQLTRFTKYDAKHLEAGDGVLVFEYGGYLHELDPTTKKLRRLEIEIRADLPWTRPSWDDLGPYVTNVALSPTGKRVVYEARGEILTVPLEHGSVRNLTQSSGAADRAPAWSPDGAHIAYFSDASGEYELVIAPQDGLGDSRTIAIEGMTFPYNTVWSPDSSKIAFTDTNRVAWYVNVDDGSVVKVDADEYASPGITLVPQWSADSKWITYAKRLDSQFRAVFVYDVETAAVHQLTDGLADAIAPVFDRNGKYIYFVASTDFGPTSGWLDMSNMPHDVTRSLYAIVLQNDEPSPLFPRSDDEPTSDDAATDGDDDDASAPEDPADVTDAVDSDGDGDGEAGGDAADHGMRIDLDGIERRIIWLPAPAVSYSQLAAGPAGSVFLVGGGDARKYSTQSRTATMFANGVSSVEVAADGKTVLLRSFVGERVVSAMGPSAGGGGQVSRSGLQARINPREEWAQMFREGWRFQRDYFYVHNVHGAEWDTIYEMYEPWVAHVGHRSDLTHLLDILGGETSVGHSFTGGGTSPQVETVPGGLLGADYVIEDDRYRIARRYTSESWNPSLRAPLDMPGVDVREGDYILSIDGRPLTADENIHARLEGRAGQQVVIEVNDAPERTDDVRTATVVPVSSEFMLRRMAWVEDCRRRVEERSDGRLAYVWLPDTGGGGYTYFNRYYFAQQDREGAVIDERFNSGGYAADYIVDILARPLMGYFNSPLGEHKPFTSPGAGIFGPKVMVINESAGSGGDYLPYMFRKRGVGPLIGTRTWGGLVGIWGVPGLIDGGYITAPRGGFFDTDGRWSVENEGVAPDIAVEQTPAAMMRGEDPQLDRAIDEALRLLESSPNERVWEQPADPVRAVRPKR